MGIGKALIEEVKQYFDTLSLCVYAKIVMQLLFIKI